MDDRLITQALQEIARKEVPDDMNRLPEIQKQLGRVSRSAVRSRTSWVVAAILAMLTVSIVAYAAARLLQTSPLDPGLQGASEADLITMLNLDQTVDGVTVTLDYAYADANRLSIGLGSTGTVPIDVQYRFGDVVLTSSEGYPITPMFGGGGGGGGGTDNPALNNYGMSTTASYDTTAIEGNPDTLNLRLETTIEVYSAVDMASGNGGGGGGGSSGSEGGSGSGGSVVSNEPPVPERIIGPFVYEFTLPFIHGQVVEPQQSATASGITMRLERLVIAPSMTRGVICLDPAAEPGYIPKLSLTVDGEPVDLTDAIVTLASTEREAPGCYDLQINQSLYQLSGEWQLSIDSLGTILPIGYSRGGDGTTADYRIDGTPEALAKVREKLEPGLSAYDIHLTADDNSLTFSFDISVVEQRVIDRLIDESIHEGVTGPWVFTFDVPPAP